MTMRFHPSRMVRPRAVLSTCSSSFMRSTGAVAVLLTAPATPAANASLPSVLASFKWHYKACQIHRNNICLQQQPHAPTTALGS